MGTVEIQNRQLVIQSRIITYGNAADPAVTENIHDEIATMWNEPQAVVLYNIIPEIIFKKVLIT